VVNIKSLILNNRNFTVHKNYFEKIEDKKISFLFSKEFFSNKEFIRILTRHLHNNLKQRIEFLGISETEFISKIVFDKDDKNFNNAKNPNLFSNEFFSLIEKVLDAKVKIVHVYITFYFITTSVSRCSSSATNNYE
jgi:hypothetical protein